MSFLYAPTTSTAELLRRLPTISDDFRFPNHCSPTEPIRGLPNNTPHLHDSRDQTNPQCCFPPSSRVCKCCHSCSELSEINAFFQGDHCHSLLRLLITRLEWKCNREYLLCGIWGRKSLPFTLALGSGEFIQSGRGGGGGGGRGFQITGSQQVG